MKKLKINAPSLNNVEQVKNIDRYIQKVSWAI